MVAELAAVKDEQQKKRVRDIVKGAEQTDGFASRVKEARTKMGLDEYLVSKLVGISPEAILQIEAGKYSNPSLVIVRRLANVLKTSVSMLVDGVTARWEDTEPKMRQSQENLFEFGEEENPKLGPAELQTLWQQYVAEVGAKRLAVAETRLEIVTKAEWKERARSSRKRTGKLFDGI